MDPKFKEEIEGLYSKYTELLVGEADEEMTEKVKVWILYNHIAKSMPALARHWRQSGKKRTTEAANEGSSGAEGLLFYASLLYEEKHGEQNKRQSAAFYRGRNRAGLQQKEEFGHQPTNLAKFLGKLYSNKEKDDRIMVIKGTFQKIDHIQN